MRQLSSGTRVYLPCTCSAWVLQGVARSWLDSGKVPWHCDSVAMPYMLIGNVSIADGLVNGAAIRYSTIQDNN